MRLWQATLTLLALAGAVRAEVSIKGPEKVEVNKLVRLEATGDVDRDAGLIWDVSPEDSADIEETGNRLFFAGPAGTYKVRLRVINFTTKKIETARITVVIGEPGPGPTPTPTPTDPLAKSLADALATDTESDKLALAAKLAMVYSEAAKSIRTIKPATAGAVWTGISAAANVAGVSGKIPKCQAAVAHWMQTQGLPATAAVKLDDATREKIALVFEKVAAALPKGKTAPKKGGKKS